MALEGYIINFRLGGKGQYPREVIIEVPGVDTEAKAATLINRKVIWVTPTGKQIIGKILKTHGRKGRVIARFRKGLPGQALGTKVMIM